MGFGVFELGHVKSSCYPLAVYQQGVAEVLVATSINLAVLK